MVAALWEEEGLWQRLVQSIGTEQLKKQKATLNGIEQEKRTLFISANLRGVQILAGAKSEGQLTPGSTESLTTSLSPPGTSMLWDCVPALMLQD